LLNFGGSSIMYRPLGVRRCLVVAHRDGLSGSAYLQKNTTTLSYENRVKVTLLPTARMKSINI
jgi:hypothetical protein